MPRRIAERSDSGALGEAYRARVRVRVAGRVPLVLRIFVIAYLAAGVLEAVHFPERGGGIVAFLLVYSAIVTGVLAAVRRRPERATPAMIVAVSLVATATSAYHLFFGASAAYCLLTITALLWTVVVFLPWGWRAQALASVGAAVAFPLALVWWPLPAQEPASTLVIYLALVIGLSVLGAELIEQYLRSDFRLTEALRERRVHLRAAKEAAERASREKGDFLAKMSHEIRTPMNVVFGMTDMVLDSDLTPMQREYLTRARSASGALLVLVNDILDFSKIEAGRMQLAPREFAVRPWLEGTIDPYLWLAREKGIDLSWQVAADVPARVVADPDRLAQVVANLVANAVKFTDRGGVALEIRPADAAHGFDPDPAPVLHWTVGDTGCGIPAAQQGAIFDAFVQGEQGRRRQGGTGLGLAICAHLVALMGGRIWVESAEGSGTRFHFTVPVVTRDAPAAGVEPAGATAIAAAPRGGA